MPRYIVSRLGQGLITLAIASLLIFGLMRMVPGGPVAAIAGEDASAETVESLREQLGLNDPLHRQYGNWVAGVLRGDLGVSTTYRVPVSQMIGRAVRPTLELVVASMIIAVVSGMLFGSIAAAFKRRWPDLAINSTASFIIGVPIFWFGLLALMVFSLRLGWFPSGGWRSLLDEPLTGLRYLALPVLVLGLSRGAVIARYVRSAMVGTLMSDHLLTARAKGLPSRRIWWHAFRSGILSVLTIIGVQLGRLLGGAVVIETVFAIPGLGRLVVSSVGARDFNTVQAILLLLIAWFVVVNLLVDIAYGYADPRARVATVR